MLSAKSLQSCPTLCDPMDWSLPGSCPWDSPGKNIGVGCHFLLQGIFLTQGDDRVLLTVRSQTPAHSEIITPPPVSTGEESCSLPGRPGPAA